MTGHDRIAEGIKQVEKKTEELIYEFHAHYEQYCQLHPEDKERKNEIFQAWVIQKIAGIQLSIIELAEKFNNFIANK